MKIYVKDFETTSVINYNGENIEVKLDDNNDIQMIITQGDLIHQMKYLTKNKDLIEAIAEKIKVAYKSDEETIYLDDVFTYYLLSEKPLRKSNGIGIMCYNGCGLCQLSEDCKCTGEKKKIRATFIKNEKWDNCGHYVTAFKKGDRVELDAMCKDNNIYCASGTSTIYTDISDFVDVVNLDDIEFIKEGE